MIFQIFQAFLQKVFSKPSKYYWTHSWLFWYFTMAQGTPWKLMYTLSEMRKVPMRSASRNSKGCAFLRCPINYGPYFSNSEELFVLLLWIVQVQVEQYKYSVVSGQKSHILTYLWLRGWVTNSFHNKFLLQLYGLVRRSSSCSETLVFLLKN